MSPQAKRRKPLSEKVKSSLKKKAEKSKFFYGELAQVYRKGQGAFLSSGSRNVPMPVWAMARVNSFLYAVRNGRYRSGKHDTDLLPEGHPMKTEKEEKSVSMLIFNLKS